VQAEICGNSNGVKVAVFMKAQFSIILNYKTISE